MPHRSGYFALAYQWDHHCHDLREWIIGEFVRIEKELQCLTAIRELSTVTHLHDYYQNWQQTHSAYRELVNKIQTRQDVLTEFSTRGYGVNIDLRDALKSLKRGYSYMRTLLDNTFLAPIKLLQNMIYCSQQCINERNVEDILQQLRRKLPAKIEHSKTIPTSAPIAAELQNYLFAMSQAPLSSNMAIFRGMFLKLGASAITLMKGSVGHTNIHSPQYLKTLAHRNFLAFYQDMFANLARPVQLNTVFIKDIHRQLTRDLLVDAGEFRTNDFIDRNGVTLQDGNFQREIGRLETVFLELQSHFDALESLLYQLARAYYTLVNIHPFSDANGRVGKCMVNYILLLKGIAPITFDEEKEIFALARYGGSVGDMHRYFEWRLTLALRCYYHEQDKLHRMGGSEKEIYNIAFDSGVCFRQIRDIPAKLEANFCIYIVDSHKELYRRYQSQGKIVLGSETLLPKVIVGCGFSHDMHGSWNYVRQIKMNAMFCREIQSGLPELRMFDITLSIAVDDYYRVFGYFNLCILCPEEHLSFNNEGLNYIYKLDHNQPASS